MCPVPPISDLEFYRVRRYRLLRDIDDSKKLKDRKAAAYKRKAAQVGMAGVRNWYAITCDPINTKNRYTDLVHIAANIIHNI